jgi:hypothetical protein
MAPVPSNCQDYPKFTLALQRLPTQANCADEDLDQRYRRRTYMMRSFVSVVTVR